MRRENLAVILTSDLSAQCRGRSVRRSEFDKYLKRGSGWVPANLALNPFGSIVEPNPFGSTGDVRLRPDPQTICEFTATEEQKITTVLSDIVEQDGSAWDCCPRTFLRSAVESLEAEAGLTMLASFEHEFTLIGDAHSVHVPFSLRSLLDKEPLGSAIMAELDGAGLEPEMWLPEYAANQWEVTLSPSDPVTAADRAVLLREIVRHTASRLGHTASFSPVVEAGGGGNGVHVHMSLSNQNGPVTYDPAREAGLSGVAGSFAAGILRHAPALVAVVAPSVVSYDRLVPGHWSVGGAFLGQNNREALLRICPIFDSPGSNPFAQFNLEFRAADATSNPWIAMGCLIRAGLEGIRESLPTPPVFSGEVSTEQLHGVQALPESLDDALKALESDEVAKNWFPPRLLQTFIALKNAEIEEMANVGEARYGAYARAY